MELTPEVIKALIGSFSAWSAWVTRQIYKANHSADLAHAEIRWLKDERRKCLSAYRRDRSLIGRWKRWTHRLRRKPWQKF